jgi:hypothetical protein
MELRGFEETVPIFVVTKMGLSPLSAADANGVGKRTRWIVQLHFGQFMPDKEALAAGVEIELPGDTRGEPRYQRVSTG